MNKIATYTVLCIISFLLLFPILFMFTNSFMDKEEMERAYAAVVNGEDSASYNDNGTWFRLIPEKAGLTQYYNVLLKEPRFLMMFWNSAILTVSIVAGQLIVAVLAAFAFSKLRFPFRDKIFFLYIIVMMMPFQVTLVPNYIVLRLMNLLDSHFAIIFPGIFTTFGVFLMRQFMLYIPDEYCEAGKIDGAGYMRILFRLVLPQCKGALASLAILLFIDNWNMVEQPLIFLKDDSMHPLSIFLSRINSDDIGIACACGFIYMLPALFIFLYGENYFIEGIQLSGIK